MQHFQIKRWDTGAVIYEGEAETLRDLVNTAVKGRVSLYRADMQSAYMQSAYMRGADMHGADMRGADMRGADMRGANMRGANMHGADMHGADMRGADMRGAYMRGAYMRGANMRGAKFGKGEILGLRVFSGLYKYTIHAYILKDGATPCVKMGCLDFTLSEWEEKGGILKSNTSEFPDDGSVESMRRARAFNYAVAEALAMKADIEAKK